MSNRVWPVDAVSGAPEYSGRALRQTQMAPLLPAATTARPLGTRSGVRPGTSPTTVTATTTTWTCRPHAGILDVLPAAEAGPYGYAIDADATGSMTPPNATNPRRDILFVQLTDPAESTGGTAPGVVLDYAAGSPAASPTAPAAPARSLVLAEINVPAVGGGNPTVTWVAPVLQSGIWPVRNVTERAALASAIGASTLNPLYVHRSDADDIGRLEVSTNGTTWRTYTATPSMPAPRTTAANGSATASGNLIRDDVLGAFTFSAVEGYVYRVAIDNVLINGGVAGDVYSVQLRIAPGASAPGGSSPLVAATQVTTPLAGSSGRQSADLGGPWVCENSGTYSVAFFLMRALGTGPGTPVSAGMSRALYAHLLYKKED